MMEVGKLRSIKKIDLAFEDNRLVISFEFGAKERVAAVGIWKKTPAEEDLRIADEVLKALLPRVVLTPVDAYADRETVVKRYLETGETPK